MADDKKQLVNPSDLTRIPTDLEGQAVVLGERMAAARAARLDYYMRGAGKSLAEAENALRGRKKDPATLLASKPGKHLTWIDFERVLGLGGEAPAELWDRTKREAHEAISSGIFINLATSEGSPWMNAIGIALRDRFRAEWQPRGGVEETLIDALAQTFMKWQFWMEKEVRWGSVDDNLKWTEQEETQSGARLRFAESAEYSARMADRSHRQFMRTLRAMRDLRRYAGAVTIHNQGNVNIAAQQQVNTAT